MGKKGRARGKQAIHQFLDDVTAIQRQNEMREMAEFEESQRAKQLEQIMEILEAMDDLSLLLTVDTDGSVCSTLAVRNVEDIAAEILESLESNARDDERFNRARLNYRGQP